MALPRWFKYLALASFTVVFFQNCDELTAPLPETLASKVTGGKNLTDLTGGTNSSSEVQQFNQVNLKIGSDCNQLHGKNVLQVNGRELTIEGRSGAVDERLADLKKYILAGSCPQGDVSVILDLVGQISGNVMIVDRVISLDDIDFSKSLQEKGLVRMSTSDKSKQCESVSESVDWLMNQLRDSGMSVDVGFKYKIPMMFAAVCGGKTGMLNVVEVPVHEVDKAKVRFGLQEFKF